jgi:hypothetical protein
MAEEFLDGHQISGHVEHALAGCVASLVHPLARGDTERYNAGPL